jgi:hypothetical protein
MEVGTTQGASVLARSRWNHTGVQLEAGGRYRLEAAGTWVDWRQPTSPLGYASSNWLLRHAERWRREPRLPWFHLVGAVSNDERTQFSIGSGTEYRPLRSGELTCFANDMTLMYWNNRGQISVTVHRIG